jgi:hypothetical protein
MALETSMASEKRMTIRGSGVLALPQFVKTRFPARYDEWLGSLPTPSRAIHTRAILASDCYSLYDALIEPTKKICDLFYGGDEKGAWEAGKFSAEYALKGFYRVFFKMGSPQFMIDRAARVFSSYYSESELRVTASSPNRCVMQVIAFPEPYRILDLRIGGWMERALELIGCKRVRVEISQSKVNGDPVTEYVSTWG